VDTIVAEDATMTLDRALDVLAEPATRLPRVAMQWALDNWSVAGPCFVSLLEDCADGEQPSGRLANILLFAIHLMGKQRETAAFPALCRFICNADSCPPVLGDAVTETLTSLLISTFDGNVTTLAAVIENPKVDEFVREVAFGALSYLAHTGATPALDMRAYLLELLQTLQPQSADYIWTSWVINASRLGYEDLTDQVADLFARKFIDPSIMGLENFRTDLRRTLDDPTHMAGFEYDRIAPFGSAIEVLSEWHSFSDAYCEDRRKAAERQLFDPPPGLRRIAIRSATPAAMTRVPAAVVRSSRSAACNRVTRRQLLRRVLADCYCRLQPSQIHGVGVFAVRDIPRSRNPFGTLARYARPGYVRVTDDELDALPPKLADTIRTLFLPTDGTMYLPTCGTNIIYLMAYLNHSAKPSLKTADGFDFVTLRRIREGEELTVDYRSYGAEALLAPEIRQAAAGTTRNRSVSPVS